MRFIAFLVALLISIPVLAQEEERGSVFIVAESGFQEKYNIYSGETPVISANIVDAEGEKIGNLLPGIYRVEWNDCQREFTIRPDINASVVLWHWCESSSAPPPPPPPDLQPPEPQPGLLVVYNKVRPEIRVILSADGVSMPLQFHGRRKAEFSYGPGEIKVTARIVGEEEQVSQRLIINSNDTVYIQIIEEEGRLQITKMNYDQVRSKRRQEKMINTYGRFKHGPHLGYRYTSGRYSVGPSSPPSAQDTILMGYGVQYLDLEFRVSGFLGADPVMVHKTFAGFQFQGQLNFGHLVWMGAGWMMEWQGLGSETGYTYIHDGFTFHLETAPWGLFTRSRDKQELYQIPRLGFGATYGAGYLPNDSGQIEWRDITYGYVYLIADLSIFPR